MKLMIAIPTIDFIHFHFTRSLIGLVQRLDEIGIDYDVCFKGGTLVYLGRDELAAEAISQKYSHVLWLDADMVFNPDIFEKLIAHGKTMVSGVYSSRHAPYKPNVFESVNPDKRVEQYPNELFEIEGCGFGIVLTDTIVLRDVYAKYGYCFQPQVGLGEDLSFCVRAYKVGHKVYCDPNVIAGHIGHVAVWPDMNRGDTD